MSDEATGAKAALKVLSRAQGLDDPRNRLRAYVATRSSQVGWLVYVNEQDFNALGKPNYLTMYLETGAHANDF